MVFGSPHGLMDLHGTWLASACFLWPFSGWCDPCDPNSKVDGNLQLRQKKRSRIEFWITWLFSFPWKGAIFVSGRVVGFHISATKAPPFQKKNTTFLEGFRHTDRAGPRGQWSAACGRAGTTINVTSAIVDVTGNFAPCGKRSGKAWVPGDGFWGDSTICHGFSGISEEVRFAQNVDSPCLVP